MRCGIRGGGPAKKKQSGYAAVLDFYGTVPLGITDEQLLGLYMNIPKLKAQRTLDAPPYSAARCTADRLYDLVLLSTESQEAAEKASKAYMAAELRSGQTPEE